MCLPSLWIGKALKSQQTVGKYRYQKSHSRLYLPLPPLLPCECAVALRVDFSTHLLVSIPHIGNFQLETIKFYSKYPFYSNIFVSF